MILEVGTEVTVRYDGEIRTIGKIERVTPKRAYLGTHEMHRDIDGQGFIRVVGNGTWNRYIAALTTEKHRQEVAREKKIRAARKYFDDLPRNTEKMLEAYDKLVQS